jgi:hypothetical protein
MISGGHQKPALAGLRRRYTLAEHHVFEGVAGLILELDTAGRLWVAWPKKASKVPTDIDFGFAQGIGLDAGLVDNKGASITDVFQGLQFVYRLKDRPKR